MVIIRKSFTFLWPTVQAKRWSSLQKCQTLVFMFPLVALHQNESCHFKTPHFKRTNTSALETGQKCLVKLYVLAILKFLLPKVIQIKPFKFMHVPRLGFLLMFSVSVCCTSTVWCACVSLQRSPLCIHLIMRRTKRLWDYVVLCSNWSFHLRAVLSNVIPDKSVSSSINLKYWMNWVSSGWSHLL